MWGVAVVAHLAGNWRYGDIWPQPTVIGVLLAVAGVLATILIVKPHRRLLLVLCAVIPVTVVLEAPVLGNHWLLAGFVSVAYLVTAGEWERFEAAARVILLLFYGFAAFAKLNTGFLDPVTSCGLFYANQGLGEVGLGPISPSSWAGWVMSWGSVLVELAIPVLLMMRRTRAWGALAAISFHGVLSLDLAQHFYDFTAVLLPLFVLFLPDVFAARFESLGAMIRPPARPLLSGVAVVVGLAVTIANVTPLTEASAWFLVRGSFLWWTPYLALVVWSAAGALGPVRLRWRLVPAAAAVAALVALNGLTPYLELKTAYGWNMYSNLVTVAGESNHLLVPSTLPLRDGHVDLVEIVGSSDPGLAAYGDERYLLPWPSLRVYAFDHPDVSVSYLRAGERVEVARAGHDPALSAPVPWWWRVMPLRAVHADTPDQCQPSFLPAL